MTFRTKNLIDHDKVCWIIVLHYLANTGGVMYEKNPSTPYSAIILGESGLLTVTFDNQRTIGNISFFSCALLCAVF